MNTILIETTHHRDSLTIVMMLWVWECSFNYFAETNSIEVTPINFNMLELRRAIDYKDLEGELIFTQNGVKYDSYLKKIGDNE